MTSETSQIQTLIHQIDEVLNKTSPRLPWVMSSDAAQQRQVLEQTRRYLLSLQSEKAAVTDDGTTTDRAREDKRPATDGLRQEAQQQEAASMEVSAQQVLQSVLQEMTYLRTNMLQPMRSDVEVLQQQRDALLQEVRRLEIQRQQYVMAQQPPDYLQNYLQAAMKQIQENLSGQVTQMLASLTAQTAQLQGMESVEQAGLATLSPVERLERLRAIQSQSDQLLLRLDTTLRVVFEALQRNLQSYQDSLGEGLGRMHDMGQQGEAVFAAFVTRLAQILGREASSFLQTPAAGWGEEQRFDYGDTARTLPGQDSISERAADRLQIENDPDQQINRLLDELNALDQSGLNQTATGEPVPFDIDDPNSPLSPEAERERLEELDRELSQLDLSALEDVPTDIEVSQTPQEDDPFFPFPPFSEGNGEPIGTLGNQPSTGSVPPALEDDLDSALDLLSQISADSSENRGETGIDIGTESDQSTESQAQDDNRDSVAETKFVSTPDDLYQDAFYQDLFGSIEGNTSESSDDQKNTNVRPAEITGDRLPEETVSELAVEGIDVNHDLFAGLMDPSESDAFLVEEQESDLEPFSEFPQSVENLLVQPSEPLPAREALTLESFLMEDVPNPMEGIEPESLEASTETIDSLADLIPDTEPEAFAEDDRSLNAADEYETAQPGEDLLITEPLDSDPVIPLRLPDDTLQQLTRDLLNLENPTRAAEAPNSDWTVADCAEAVDASPEAEPTQDATQLFQSSDWMEDSSAEEFPPRLSNQAIEEMLFTDRFTGDAPTDSSGSSDVSASFGSVAPEGRAPADSSVDRVDSPEGDDSNDSNALLETTIEDWFANVDAEPVVTPEASQQETSSQSPSQDSEPNTFTLDGLSTLFEGAPSVSPPHLASGTDTQRITVDDVFGDTLGHQLDQADPPPEDRSSAVASSPAIDRAVEKKKYRWNSWGSD